MEQKGPLSQRVKIVDKGQTTRLITQFRNESLRENVKYVAYLLFDELAV